MNRSETAVPVLAAGDPARLAAGRGVRGSLLLAGMFVLFAWTAKEVPALYARVPWQDDPYDALISATIFFVPVLVALCLVRAPLCRRHEPLPARRVVDLLRACQVLAGTVLVTLAGEWVSVAVRAHRSAWTPATLTLIGVLALLTVASGAVAAQLERARRNLPAESRLPAQPDWLADAAALGEHLAARLGGRHDSAARALSRTGQRTLTRLRRHPAWSAAAAALAFGVCMTASQAIAEGYRARLVLLFLTVSVSSMLAFLLAAGAYLRLTGPRPASSRPLPRAVTTACASVPVTFAFRAALLKALSLPPHHALPDTAWLALLVASTTGGTVLAAGLITRWHAARAQRRTSTR